MDVYWNIRSEEILQTARMISVEMAQNDCLDVFHTVSCLCNSFVEILFFVIFDLSKNIVRLRLLAACQKYPGCYYEESAN